MKALAGTLLLLCAPGAQAHIFGQTYVLPLPFWMYAFTASAALVLSFAVVGYFATANAAQRPAFALPQGDVQRPQGATFDALRALSIALLVLTMLSAFFGTSN